MGLGIMGGAAAQAALNAYLQFRSGFRADAESKAKIKASEYDLKAKQGADYSGNMPAEAPQKEAPGVFDTIKGWFSSDDIKQPTAAPQPAMPQPAAPVMPTAMPVSAETQSAPAAEQQAPTPAALPQQASVTAVPQQAPASGLPTRSEAPATNPMTFGTPDAPSAKLLARATQMMNFDGPGGAKVRAEGEKLYERAKKEEMQERVQLIGAGKAAIGLGDWDTAAKIATRNIPNGVKYEFAGMSDDGKLPVFNIQHGTQEPQRVPVHPANMIGMLDEMAKDPAKYFEQTMKQGDQQLERERNIETGRHNLASEKLTESGQRITMRGQDMTQRQADARLGVEQAKLRWDKYIETARLKAQTSGGTGAGASGGDPTTVLNKVLTAAGGDYRKASGAVDIMMNNPQLGQDHLKALTAQDDIEAGIKKGTYKPAVGISMNGQTNQPALNLSVNTKQYGTVSMGSTNTFDEFVGRFSNDENADPAKVRELVGNAALQIANLYPAKSDTGPSRESFGQITALITPNELQKRASQLVQQGVVKDQAQAMVMAKQQAGDALDRLYFAKVKGGHGLGKYYVDAALEANLKKQAKADKDAEKALFRDKVQTATKNWSPNGGLPKRQEVR